jgi:hypothetical protein
MPVVKLFNILDDRHFVVYRFTHSAASLAPRKLLLTKVVDASGRIVDVDSIARDLNLIRKSYGQQNSIESLLIRDGENTRNFLMEWLK